MKAGVIIALCTALVFALIDIRKREVPVKAVMILALPALAYALITGFGSAVLGALTGFLLTFIMFMLGALGGGDVKLYTLLGCFLGAQAAARSLVIALFACAVVGAVMILITLVRRSGKDIRTMQTPFVPFMFLGIALNIFL
ncbi:MAG: prepilin peptidase [Ruminococcus sp.]|nr:prepilin peptidase [Ruminococcus sp.]